MLHISSAVLRLPVRRYATDAHYPINFVVKDPNLFVLPRRPALRRWKTCRNVTGLIPDRRRLYNGGDQEAVHEIGGADRDRTDDPLLAKQVLSQLSYSPMVGTCGRDGGPG
jgi:hypothetical protein